MNKFLAILFSFFTVVSHAQESDVRLHVKTKGMIVGGTPAKADDKVTASTVSLFSLSYFSSICSGTVIAKDLILTATHCLSGSVEPSDIRIFLGHTLPTDQQDKRLVKIQKIQINENYKYVQDSKGNPVSAQNDVALIKLEKPLEGATPVAILDPSIPLHPGQNMLLAGYGLIDDMTGEVSGLNWVEVSMAKIVYDHILVTDQTAGMGGCAGDSGGPAFYKDGDRLLVFGVTRGPHDGASHCHAYGEYTHASYFKDFILDNARLMGADMPVFAVPQR